MSKIGIVTIVDGCNYGNRLQNYALQSVLKSMGHEAYTVRHTSSRDISRLRRFLSISKNIARRALHRNHNLLFYKRKKAFATFNSKYISFTPEVLTCNSVPVGFEAGFDCFIVGSDQVWNANFDFIREDLHNYLLGYVPDNKRVAYAASFGASQVPADYKTLFAEELPRFRKLGVREIEGVSIARSFGATADVVLDPTLLIDCAEWERISQKPHYLSSGERFIVTYIMSGRTEKLNKHIDVIKGKYDAEKVINLDIEFLWSKDIDDENHYITNPSEFLWLINNAQCVITDSYHASVFSVLFHKPILLYKRQGIDMSNRLATLMELIDSEMTFDDYDNPILFPTELDYTKTDRLIQNASVTSQKWLHDALEDLNAD